MASITMPRPTNSGRWYRISAALLLAGLIAASCDSVDRAMGDPTDPAGKHLRQWRDDVRRGEQR